MMAKAKGSMGLRIGRAALGALVVAVLAMGMLPVSAWADDTQDARHLVEKAQMTLENFQTDPTMGEFRETLKRAKAVLILSQVVKVGFLFGGSGGSGVMMASDGKGGWNGPAFYTLGAVSFGALAGAEASEVVVLAMTERGLNAMLRPSVKLGADASIALGPVGAGVAAATANLSVDLVSFARAKGLYAGLSVDGAVVGTRDGLNRAYYGREVTPTDILLVGDMTNPHAGGLTAKLTQMMAEQK
jgi:lipid-binding SYLF domain-containing protein